MLVPAGLLGLGTGGVVGLVGGSILAVPALVYGLGVPVAQAVPTALLVVPPEPRGACEVPGGRIDWRACLPKARAIGAGVGFLTGLLGVGGGFVIVPALAWLLGLPMPAAIGTSLVLLAINSLAGLAAHLGRFQLDLGVAGAFLGAAALAALVAAKIAGRAARAGPAARLRRPGARRRGVRCRADRARHHPDNRLRIDRWEETGMEPNEVHAQRERVQLVDVRDPGEWQAGRTPDDEQPGEVA